MYSDVLCARYSTFVSGVQASDHIFDWSLESLTWTFAYEKMYDVTWSLVFQNLVQAALV